MNCIKLIKYRIYIFLICIFIFPHSSGAVDLESEGWIIPSSRKTNGIIEIPKFNGPQSGLIVNISEYSSIVAPQSAKLLYAGRLGQFEKGFVLEHSSGLISLIYSFFDLEETMKLTVGMSISKGQLLAGIRSGNSRRDERILFWNLHQLDSNQIIEFREKLNNVNSGKKRNK